MNQLEFSYEDYLDNLTKSCEKMENFNSTALDDNCLDQAPDYGNGKFMIEDQEDASIDTNLNLSSSLSNTLSNTLSSTLSSTISNSSISTVPNDYQISLTTNDVYTSVYGDVKLDLTKQLQKAKSIVSTKNSNTEINSTKTKVPIKKRKVGVNHKFVNNPKHLKKTKPQEPFISSPFQLKFLKPADLSGSRAESDKLSKSISPQSNSSKGLLHFTHPVFNLKINQSISFSPTGLGCGKPGYITCSICNATKYYSHVQRRFGQFSCEPCSKFMKKFLKDPKVYYCLANGMVTVC